MMSGDAPPDRRAGPEWGEAAARGSDAGSRPPRREFQDRPAAVERAPTAADLDDKWRSKMRPDAPSPAPTPDVSTPSSPAAPQAPASRPRLNLAKRTVSEAPKEGDATDAPAAAPKTSSSIFGAARPIDTSSREREIQEKRELAIREKKEKDDKAREEKRSKEAASKADRAAATATGPTSPKPDTSSAPKEILPRENGGRKASETKDGADATSPAPAAGRQYEILRRAAETEGDDGDATDETRDPDAPENGDIVGDKATLPQEVTREVPIGEDASSASATVTGGETTAEKLEEDGGWSTVPAKAKPGRRGGGRALAS